MVLLGTFVNGLCIIVGTLLGLFFTKIPERFKETVMSGVGLAVILIGLQMAFETDNIVIVLLSLLTGAIIGEAVHLEDKLEYIGRFIERKFTKPDQESSMAQGFITASLIFVIGALSVIGALDSGLRNDHEVLITKAIIDGFVSLVLTSTLGIGVIFSVIPVVLYEGSIALLATQINRWIPQDMLDLFIMEMTATGGLLIVAIGLNLLKLTKIRVANLLPSLLMVGVVFYISQWF
ncbi:DUF554 domain-containing protein [Halobacillus halophilus]|uniref:DUF554 domain-containing protein n=1 Tax=Halobacillus halophilus (strain ATCC 35676 / DSM 2266 / JCM 20832 / KCTC 3685 / LMG 17431 / NBRC 102448 / NCIMB 2269) TaxID=866895 RepID=I0JTL3_HALH3|nr:DUF554 domain-containing protein [Halobacillus halophilus]ASF41394.1 DUF554 domain-containing protein [Halobacillus halophilus]CCG47486.1 conserved hypothetical protein [Halobacillus halophilus DSM 2266]